MLDSQTTLTVLVAIVLIAVTVIPYFVKYRSRERRAREAAGAGRGSHPALALHPTIDVLSCIGCGSCAKACPEGDVLGLVDGTAALIHGSRCVGHGLCAEACPVGAIRLIAAPPGTVANTPVLGSDLNTSIPNVFIAGELGGIGLIKNAVEQGIRAAEAAARFAPRGRHDHDLIIIGAGPAGMAAALTARHRGLSYIVIEQDDIGGTILHYPRRKIVLTAPVHLPGWGRLNLRDTTKEALLEVWQKIIAQTAPRIETSERVVDVAPLDGGFRVTAGSGKTWIGTQVLFAMGRRGTPRKLGVPGEDLSNVAYRLIDAESYQGCDILIVGGGDSAVEAALGLANQKGNRVTLSYRGKELTRIKERNRERLMEAASRRRVKIELESNVQAIERDQVIISDRAAAQTRLPNDYVFIFAGGEPPYGLLKKLGVRFHESTGASQPA